MRFVAKAVIEVEFDAVNELAAKNKFEADMKSSNYGVKRRILLEPNFETGEASKD